MAKRSVGTELGRLSLVAAEERFLEPAIALAVGIARRNTPTGEMTTVSEKRVYWKGSALFGKASLRYACRRALLFQPLPRMREFANLRWLRRRLFQAPRPIAAGVFWRGGLPVHQFLATEEVPDAVDLGRFFDTHPVSRATDSESRATASGAELRAGVLDEIACEVARMHSLGFLHHDLFLRNVLVVAARPHSRVWFVDAWAGGPRPNLRAASYDVDCFLHDAQPHVTSAEAERFVAAYRAELAALAVPARARRSEA